MFTSLENSFGKPIYTYTRNQALEDGILVDVSEIAKEAGFKCPVAVTAKVWKECCEWTEADSKRQQTYQDTDGCLWDVLYMLHCACKSQGNSNRINYSLYVVPRGGKAKRAKLTRLKSLIGAGDNGEMVITIMFPDED